MKFVDQEIIRCAFIVCHQMMKQFNLDSAEASIDYSDSVVSNIYFKSWPSQRRICSANILMAYQEYDDEKGVVRHYAIPFSHN